MILNKIIVVFLYVVLYKYIKGVSMPSHDWSDEKFDWKALYSAERDLNKIMRFFRIGVHSKEKYGTLRASVYFWDGGLHDLIWPGYMYIQNSFIRWKLDEYVLKPFTKYTGLLYVGNKLQRFGYKLAYAYVMLKYSHIVDELVCCADHYELLINGEKLESKFWVKSK